MDNVKIAYITSMKKGLPSFVFREISEIKKSNFHVEIYATKYSQGMYMPTDFVYRMRPVSIILKHVLFPFVFWKEYFKCLSMAVRTRSIVEFLIACDFALKMKKRYVTHIHCVEGLMSFNIGYYCKRLLKLPLSVTIYADGLYIAPSPALFKAALEYVDTIVTICEYNKKILLEKYCIPEEKIKLIPVILDTEKFQPRRFINILIVAQFAERKGHRFLFDAVKRINRQEIKIWVVGNRGTDKTYVNVHELVTRLNMEDDVIFWGNLSEPALHFLYQACDIFCLPSVNAEVPEGTPVALMEAMAYEKPVVTTRHAGIPEYVENMLVDENDVESLAKAIQFLIDNPDERIKQGVMNRKKIMEKFSIQNAQGLTEVFLEK